MALIDAAAPDAARVNAEIEALYGTRKMKELLAMLADLERSLGSPQPGEGD